MLPTPVSTIRNEGLFIFVVSSLLFKAVRLFTPSLMRASPLFVSADHGFYTLGNEHLPVPRAFYNFPPYSIDLRDAHVESGTLVIPAVVVLGGEENPGRYRLLAKLQLTTPGKGCHTGMLRNYLADASCDSAVVHIRVPDYSAIIGSASTSCQVHGRFILLDNVTGYRSQYHKETFRISVR